MKPARLLVAALATGVATTTCVLAAPAAQATNPVLGAQLTFGLDTSLAPGSDCTSNSPSSTPITLSGGQKVTRSATMSGTATANGDPTDTVQFHGTASSTVSSSVTSTGVKSADLTAKASISYTAAKGSASTCLDGMMSGSDVSVSYVFKQSKPAWVHIHSTGTSTGGLQVGSILEAGTSLPTSEVEDMTLSLRGSTSDHWVYLGAGEFAAIAGFGVDVGAAQTPGLRSASGSGSVQLTFVPAGSAAAAEAGKGKPDVTLPAALVCGTSPKATVTLTRNVKGAASVALFVDGKQVKTVKHPKPAKLTLAGLPATKNVSLKAVVTVKGKKLTATRAYRSC